LEDASRRWRMESHLHWLMAVVDATPDVFFLTDAEFKPSFVNAVFQTVTGHGIEEAPGRTADFLRVPEEAATIRGYLAQVAKGQDWCGGLRNVRAEGSVYPVSATITPIHDRNGGFLGYVASERDISAHKRLEGGPQRERDFVRRILDPMDAAIHTLDSEFRLTRVTNGPAEAINGIIRTVKRKARGFRSVESFSAIIHLVASHLKSDLPDPLPATHTKSS